MPRIYFKDANGDEDYEDFTQGEVRSGEYREALEALKASGTFLRKEL